MVVAMEARHDVDAALKDHEEAILDVHHSIRHRTAQIIQTRWRARKVCCQSKFLDLSGNTTGASSARGLDQNQLVLYLISLTMPVSIS